MVPVTSLAKMSELDTRDSFVLLSRLDKRVGRPIRSAERPVFDNVDR